MSISNLICTKRCITLLTHYYHKLLNKLYIVNYFQYILYCQNINPNTNFSAMIDDQHLSLLQIKKPHEIQPQNSIVREAEKYLESEESEVSQVEGGADTLARDPSQNLQSKKSLSQYRSRANALAFSRVESQTVNGDNNKILKLFPDRLIKVSSFIDLLGSQFEGQDPVSNRSLNSIKMRNPTKKLASDIDFSVKELSMQLLEQNIKLKMTKVKDFVYQVTLPTPQSDSYTTSYYASQKPKELVKTIKLGLSGGMLVVNVGGGYFDFLEYLDRKGVLCSANEKNEHLKYQTL